MNYSFSSLSLYRTCPQAYYLLKVPHGRILRRKSDRKPFSRPKSGVRHRLVRMPQKYRIALTTHIKDVPNFFAQFGTLGHSILERWEKGKIPMLAMAETYDKEFEQVVTVDPPPFPRGMYQKLRDLGYKYFDTFNDFDYENYEILEVEKQFCIELCDRSFVGLADLILRNLATGGIEIIDHKSKSANSMKKELNIYKRQLYLYAAYVKEKYGEFPTRLRFNMFREGTWIDIDFSMDEYEETLDWMRETIQMIESDTTWEARPKSYYCRYICGAADACTVEGRW